MRWGGYILTFIILLFSGMPCCASELLCDDAAKTVCTSETGRGEEPGSNEPCSPFNMCGTCVGFLQVNGVAFDSPVAAYAERNIILFPARIFPVTYVQRHFRPPII